MRRRRAAVLSAGVAGYGRLLADDEQATLGTLGAWRDVIASRVRRHGGRVAEVVGDAVLAEFANAVDATHCAAETQKELEGRNAVLPRERRIRWRVGIHVGEVQGEGEELWGEGVERAQQLASDAEPGGIWVSDAVADRVRGRLNLDLEKPAERPRQPAAGRPGAWRVTAQPLLERLPLEPAPPAPGPWKRALALAALLLLAGAAAATAWLVLAGRG